MKRLVSLLLLVIATSASAQMWRQLATSPVRIDSSDVSTLRLEVDNITFLRDNEYSSRLTKGYTLPGLWLQPKLTFTPHRQVRLETGFHALLFNGANKYPCYVYHDIGVWKGDQYQSGAHLLPWFRAQVELGEVDIVLGNIYGGENHELAEPLWNAETNLSQDPEMGVQVLWRRHNLRADAWLNWQSYIFQEASHQEAFTFGMSWRFLLNDESARTHWYVPLQVVIQHRGGEQDTTQLGTQTLANLDAGFGVSRRVNSRWLTGVFGQIDVSCSYQQKGDLWPFKSGLAFHAIAGANLWNALHLRIGHFTAPHHFVSLYGSPFFCTIGQQRPVPSSDTPYADGINTTYARLDFSHTFARHYVLGAELEAYQSWLGDSPSGHSSEFNFAFGIYFRANPSFLLKRFNR